MATDFTKATLTDGEQPFEQGAKVLPDAQPAQRGPTHQEQHPGDIEAMQQREGIARAPALPSGEQARVPSMIHHPQLWLLYAAGGCAVKKQPSCSFGLLSFLHTFPDEGRVEQAPAKGLP
jgi:hypothetical protein